ncbi:glutamate--cysteine ligase [Synechococcus sp. KORDI-52]|uniref:glutamate--cysteine ligase n=1 Tax=Synechococcus sp. KORDI-52 TaxID=585425 RepID=UPI0004E085F9|nr:glutamate--cysteine ligase [Synechococcus sp. KORDI-52]AII47662.1 glutamate--cysteine ligase [Synechococcus sp. KORDI-52]
MTAQPLLLKGFEVELFTGRTNGANVGVASDVARDLPGFVTEPDCRNLEYVTDPIRDYTDLPEALLAPRRTLRQWLQKRELTILPGSTMSLGNSSRFERSDPSNSYHALIERLYGTRVVTASIHINLGITDLDWLFAALRLVRCEAALFLALSASSPFLDGRSTRHHSQRWHQFPLTPPAVPLFRDHKHYIHWVEEQLATGAMRNERHLWTSVRPNGPRRPYDLNRLELRICDLVTNPHELLAITCLLELRLLALKDHMKTLDPLRSSSLSADELAQLADSNDAAAAQSSLNAELRHWRDGRSISCRDWVLELLDELSHRAESLQLSACLRPLEALVTHGNQAMRWEKAHGQGQSISDLLQDGIQRMQKEEQIAARDDCLG